MLAQREVQPQAGKKQEEAQLAHGTWRLNWPKQKRLFWNPHSRISGPGWEMRPQRRTTRRRNWNIAPKLNIATGETSQVITSRHFSSLLFTSMSILTSLALINWKANTIHIHISNNSTFPFISLHFILSLLLSIERQKQYKYINKAIQKAQLSSYILVTHTEIF